MIHYKNNTESTLAAGITDSDLTLSVGTSDGDLFPVITSPDVFLVTLSNQTGFEIVKVTARVDNVFTIERAQEGTTAKAFAMGDKVQMFITAGHFEDLRDNSLRLDNVPTDVISGLNADKLDGVHSSEFYLTTTDLRIDDPKVIDFGGNYREDIKLYNSYAEIDPYWANVVLLIPMNGSLGSSVFLDKSPNPKTITPYGDVKYSVTQSKFGGSSVYFDGAADYLSIPSHTDFNLSSSDFTIETWIYPTATIGSYRIIITRRVPGTGTTSWQIFIEKTTGKLGFYNGSSEYTNGLVVPTNQWSHVALCYNNNTHMLQLYLNGEISIGGNYLNASSNADTSPVQIGHFIHSENESFIGYMQDFRITKGAIRYSSDYTVPSSAFSDTGSSDPYLANNYLHLHFEGANGSTTFTDSSPTPKTLSVFGNAQISTSKYRFGSSCGYFDGNGDYLRTTAMNLTNKDFTIECWVYLLAMPTSDNWPGAWNSHMEILGDGTPSLGDGFSLLIGQTKIIVQSNDSAIAYGNHNMVINRWYHLSIVRSNGWMGAFVDGSLKATYKIGTSNVGTGSYLWIGSETGQGAWLNGYIDELRITINTGRYPLSISNIPTAPHTPLGWTDQTYDPYYLNTALLLHFDGTSGSQAFTDDSVTPKSITAYGNAQISSTQSKFGETSGYFDGNGDYLTSEANVSDLNFQGQDFTIECWCYPDDQTVNYPALVATEGGWYAGAFGIRFDNTGQTQKFTVHWNGQTPGDPMLSSPQTYAFNTWHHVAVTRRSNTLSLYVNGAFCASASIAGGSVLNLCTGGRCHIGWGRWDGAQGYYKGYIDELRITKGLARYTTNFTPAALPFAGIKNLSVDQDLDKVSLLLHFNGSNLSTSFIDSSPNQKAITRYGDAKISTTQSKFGGSSGYFDGTNDWLTTPGTSDLSFGTGDFTIEFWANSDDISANSKYVFGTDTTGCWQIAFNGSQAGKIGIARHNITWDAEYTHNLASHTWAHFAIVRLNGVLTFYKDGTSIGSGSNSLAYNAGTTFYVGGHASIGYTSFNGYLDEIRITKGVARYTTSFTPPPVPFVDGNRTISIGTQSNTLYQRSSGNFAWYKGGNYSGTDLDPGVDGSVRMVLNEAGNLLIGKTSDNGEGLLQVNGTISASSLNISGAVASIEVGWGRTVDGYAYIDLVGDTTYTDYGLRIIRNDTGANTSSGILHCGTGDMLMTAIHAAPIILGTTSTERLRITSGGRVLIGAGTDDSTNLLQVNGNLAFIGSSRRIVGDFSNATVSSRTIVQTSTSNGNTGVFFIPNGSGSASYLMPMNGSDPANCGYLILGVNASTCQIGARKQGSGTTVPLAFDIDGSEKMRLDTSGNLGIGVSPSMPLHLYRSTVSAEFRLEGGSTSESVNTAAIAFYQSSSNVWMLSKRSSGWGGRANNFEISYYNGSWADLFAITTSGRVLIGTTTDGGYAKLTISGGDTPVTPHPDVVLQIVNSNTTARFLIDTHSDTVSSVITGRRSRGTAAAPTAVQADTDLLSITGTGYSNTWVNSARAMIRFSSAQTWTATANGTYIAFHTTQNDAVAHSERLRITDSGRILIGTTTDDGTNLLQVNGDQAFIGSSRRIRGDFSNATLGSRTLFQTSTSNQPTHLAIIPNGTAVLSSFGATNSSDTSNFGYMSVGISDSYASVVSGIAGSGTYLPIAFFTSSSERMRLSTGGRLLIGTVTDDATNTLQVNGSIVQSPLASVTPTNNGELVFEATSNTTITVKYKGSDGTVRTGTITLT